MTLRSSAFITLVLGYLMVMGYHNQPVVLERTQTPPTFSQITRGPWTLPSEKISIEVFDDLECPSCSAFALETLPKIRALGQETDGIDVHLYFIPNLNDETLAQAAQALKCANDQGLFWEYYAALHKLEEKPNAKILQNLMKEVEGDPKALTSCLDKKTFESAVQSDLQYASEKEISVKPTLLINEYRLVGAQPFENIQKIVRQVVAGRPAFTRASISISKSSTDLEQELKKAFQLTTEPQLLTPNN